jgi:hypothetical protein
LSRSISSWVCLLLLAGAAAARAQQGATITADTAWQSLDDREGVALFSRGRVGSALREFKAAGIIEAPPAAVQKVLEDVKDYPKFMPYVAEARPIMGTGSRCIVYERLAVPVVANRDYTIYVENGATTTPSGETILRDVWRTDNDAGPAPRHGIVRVKVNEGSWVLEPFGPAHDETKATYQIYTDSGGVLPAFVANKASQLMIPKVFKALRQRVQAK